MNKEVQVYYIPEGDSIVVKLLGDSVTLSNEQAAELLRQMQAAKDHNYIKPLDH